MTTYNDGLDPEKREEILTVLKEFPKDVQIGINLVLEASDKLKNKEMLKILFGVHKLICDTLNRFTPLIDKIHFLLQQERGAAND